MIVDVGNSDFTLENIPFGVILVDNEPHCASAIGNYAIDLNKMESLGFFNGKLLKNVKVFSYPTLNKFMSMGRSFWREARETIQNSLNSESLRECLIPLDTVENILPVDIGDYTDFYASKEHATNVGTMFRGKENALMPNWTRIPVGYHGRASSVIVSGTKIIRPNGQILNANKEPEYKTCRKLDIELEMGFFVGVGNSLGHPIDINNAEEHIFGCVLLNDWSARDIQQFEYVPLGPFLGKNFGTTISPWIITMDALEPFRVQQPEQNPIPCSYLQSTGNDAYDIELQVELCPKGSKPSVISTSNLKYMYWTFKQQLAHHTVNGCNMRPGDLCGTGTISGPTRDSFGSLLEITWNGSTPLDLGGESRTFLEDGDEVILRGRCKLGNKRLGFGECRGIIMPSLNPL